MKRLSLLLLIVLIIPFGLFSQEKLTENTLRLDSSQVRPIANIEDMSWYANRWVGEGFGAEVEENFAPPLGGTMIGTFRMVKDGQPAFYELLLIEAEGNSLVYKVKHFNPDFTGWEEKENYVPFKLVKIEGNRYYFDGLTFERRENECWHYLAMRQKDGSYKETILKYRLVD